MWIQISWIGQHIPVHCVYCLLYIIMSYCINSETVPHTSSLCEKGFRPFVSYCHISFKIAHRGHITVVWRVNFELREVTGSFLRGTPGASVLQCDGGFLPDRGERMDEIRSSQPGPQETQPLARCAICSLVLFVYLSPLPLAVLIVLHGWLVPCSEPLVVKLFLPVTSLQHILLGQHSAG